MKNLIIPNKDAVIKIRRGAGFFMIKDRPVPFTSPSDKPSPQLPYRGGIVISKPVQFGLFLRNLLWPGSSCFHQKRAENSEATNETPLPGGTAFESRFAVTAPELLQLPGER